MRASSIAVVVVVAVTAVEITTLILPLLVVATVGCIGTLDVTNPIANVVDVVICDDDFKVFSISKKGIVTTTLMAVNLATLVVDTTVLAKDAGASIVVKTLGNGHHWIQQGTLVFFRARGL